MILSTPVFVTISTKRSPLISHCFDSKKLETFYDRPPSGRPSLSSRDHMMSLLFVLHPIFANTIPDDEANPTQCILHDVFWESLLQVDEQDAAELLRLRPESNKMNQSLYQERFEMDSLGPAPTKAIYSAEVGREASTLAESDRPSGERYLEGSYELVDNANEDIIAGLVPPPLSSGTRPSSPPSLIEDRSSSSSSTCSNESEPELEAQPLTVSLITKATPVNPLLNTQFMTIPKQRVHFHPSHTTRTYSDVSYSAEFQTSTFAPTHQPDQDDPETRRRRQLNATLDIETTLQVRPPRERNGMKAFPRTCVDRLLAGQNVPTTPRDSRCEHKSLQAHHSELLTTLTNLHAAFRSDISTSGSFTAQPSATHLTRSLENGMEYLTVLRQDIRAYLTAAGYWGDERKMATCADTCDVDNFREAREGAETYFKKLRTRFWREERQFWVGERERVEREVQDSLMFGK